jgi:hypothetical protein
MSWLTIFGNLAAGTQPLSLFDAMFGQVANLVAIPATAAGANTINLTGTSNAPTISSYVQFQMFRFVAAATSSGAVTANYQGLGQLNVYRPDGITRISSGDLIAGQEYLMVYSSALNSGAGGFFLENATPLVAAGGGVFEAGGRLTLSTGVPVMTSSVTGATAHYYTPYKSQYVPLNVSGTMTMTNIGGELSQATTDATKSPAAVAASSCYYVFVWNDGGTYRCTRGPAWTNDNTPGAGNTLSRLQGVLVNTNAITNGPGSLQGTLVGGYRSDGASQLNWKFGAAASGGSAGNLALWNMYNRIPTSTIVTDNGTSYAASLPLMWRQARASVGNQINFFVGLVENPIQATYAQRVDTQNAATASGSFGIGLNTTTFVFTEPTEIETATANIQTGAAPNIAIIPVTAYNIGYNYIAALENTWGTVTFNLDSLGTLSFSSVM